MAEKNLQEVFQTYLTQTDNEPYIAEKEDDSIESVAGSFSQLNSIGIASRNAGAIRMQDLIA